MRRTVKRISVSDLRYHFSEVERLLHKGARIEITKRGHVIAQMVPVPPKAPTRWPDFLGRLRAIYGDQMLKTSGAELLAEERDHY